MSPDDTTDAAVKRAKSYFLVCAIIGNSLTFALGPKLLDCEESPDPSDDKDDDDNDDDESSAGSDAEAGNAGDEEEAHEHTSLLPGNAPHHVNRASRKINAHSSHHFSRLPSWLQSTLSFMHSFLNAPLIGAIIGLILGLAPPLHRLFFNSPPSGGYFNAWLTTAVRNIGELFAALQLVIVGSKLSSSLRKMKRGEESGEVRWFPMMFVFAVRFLIWPL
jgi:predicted permease